MELIIYCLSFLTVALVIQAGPLTVEIHWLQFKVANLKIVKFLLTTDYMIADV